MGRDPVVEEKDMDKAKEKDLPTDFVLPEDMEFKDIAAEFSDPSSEAAPITPETIPQLEETYPLIPPFAYTLIQTDPDTKQTRYMVVEVPLSEEETTTFNMIREILTEELELDFSLLRDREKTDEYLKQTIMRIIRDYAIKLDERSLDKIVYYITRDYIGFGTLEPLLRDHMIEDISCDGVGVPIYIWHRKYDSIPTNILYDEDKDVDSVVIKMAQRAGRHISIASPLLDASLPDGSRVQLTLGREVTQNGSTFTIRKFRADPLTITDLVMFNTLSVEMAAYLWFCIENRHSALIAGGIASGKTTLLNSLSMFILPDLKIISIEDTAELNIPHENWIPSVARTGFGAEKAGRKRGQITLFDLLKAALRQRPDYILVGEIRGAEAYSLFQAMATGHLGMATIHGDSVTSVMHRLTSEPMNIPRALLASLDIVVVQRKIRYGGKSIRRSIALQEMIGLDPVTRELLTNRAFVWNAQDDSHQYLGRSVILEKIMDAIGVSERDIWDEIERRKIVLRWMVKNRIRYYEDVANVIREYVAAPEETYEKARRGLT
ncbi:type II/IV secretion system ATPase subunit [Candidatus Borrarchaeum sp.]|uniref:type II/IV secretion system ATPase subunit n=1 Tax=Candidatus Borrarchaeum sp. TaxID=2846742 RepID=UPI00257B06B9|nr:type II/IV secretion system ATPase subunit [Candidatus Borrarchaeum sp.]